MIELKTCLKSDLMVEISHLVVHLWLGGWIQDLMIGVRLLRFALVTGCTLLVTNSINLTLELAGWLVWWLTELQDIAGHDMTNPVEDTRRNVLEWSEKHLKHAGRTDSARDFQVDMWPSGHMCGKVTDASVSKPLVTQCTILMFNKIHFDLNTQRAMWLTYLNHRHTGSRCLSLHVFPAAKRFAKINVWEQLYNMYIW